jgi:hypothetical protein
VSCALSIISGLVGVRVAADRTDRADSLGQLGARPTFQHNAAVSTAATSQFAAEESILGVLSTAPLRMTSCSCQHPPGPGDLAKPISLRKACPGSPSRDRSDGLGDRLV